MDGLDALWALGARWITFGGGEPLVKEDIGEILRYSRIRGFQTYLSTNGVSIPEHLDALEWVNHVNVSLDGGERVHDAIRGAGSYRKVITAIEACRDNHVPVSLQCTLSSENLECVETVVQFAAAHRVSVMFQPATQWLDSSTKPNPIAPPVEPYRKAIDAVIAFKRRGARVRNSIGGLQHLRQWPDPTPIWCSAGAIACVVEADGTLLACHQAQVSAFLEGPQPTTPFKTQFAQALPPQGCVQCWCAPVVELALLFKLRPEAIWNAVRMFL
jgi:MoaA/NifB/PqqE/SkfB family radical SAM enzyme